MSTVDLSVILPVYNEEESIQELHIQVKTALNKLKKTYQIIYVDDGSHDQSFAKLKLIATKDSYVSVIRFRRNYGQTSAISAGIDHAKGNVIVLLDADLQNDPADIGLLLDKINEGYDVVSGWRKNRQDANLKRKIPSHIANAIISRVTGVHLHDYGCTLKAYRREVLDSVRLYGEMHRFIPAYAFWAGARITEIPVNHHARKYGKSKYGLSRIFRVILDLLTVKFLGDFSTKPSYMFGTIGLSMLGVGIVSFIFSVIQKMLTHQMLHTNPIAIFSGMAIFLAMQTLLLGLLAELLMRTYHESQSKTTYVVREMITENKRLQPVAQNRDLFVPDYLPDVAESFPTPSQITTIANVSKKPLKSREKVRNGAVVEIVG